MEEQVQDVKEEVVEPQAQNSEETHEEVAVQSQEHNWKQVREALREAKEREARRERELEELRSALQSVQSQNQPKEEDIWAGLDDSEVLEVSKAKALVAKEAQRAAQKAVEEARRREKSDPVYLESVAKAKYADFDQVMSQENIEQIIKANPSRHQSILRSDNPIEAAYDFIKHSASFAQKQKPQRNDMLEKAKVAENQKKPKSPNQLPQNQAVSTTMGFGRLTKEQQKEAWVSHLQKLGRRS